MTGSSGISVEFASADRRYAIIRIDFPPLNIGSLAMRGALSEALQNLAVDPLLQGVVLTGSGDNFVAGSDIREFDAPPEAPHLPDVISIIENMPFPVVAAIEGAALGGGCELALGCDWRIGAASAVMGLPEVTLGLVPGAGGTVRLPRLVGAELALDLVTSGRRLNADQALACGLIDEIARGDVVDAALRWIGTHPLKRRLLDLPLPELDKPSLEMAAQRITARDRGLNSVGEAVSAVLRAIELPVQQALALEREASLRLRVSAQSKALRYLFQAERRAGRAPKGTASRAIRHIGIIGAGRMGSDIAFVFAASGFRVSLVEASSIVAKRALVRLRENAERKVRRGGSDDIADIVGRITFAGIEELVDCHLIIEAIPEDLGAKRKLFARLDEIVRTDAILATNTSYLDIDEIAAPVSGRERVVGMHFFNPATALKLVEVVRTSDTSDDVMTTMLKLARQVGKLPIVTQIGEGFVGNRIFAAYRRQCEYLIEDGCEPDQIDHAMTEFGMAMGPFAVFDLAGLDIAWAMRKRLSATRPASERYVDVPDRLCELGRFGRTTGKGWYDYEDGKPMPSPQVSEIIRASRADKQVAGRAFAASDIVDALLTAMVSEAALVEEEGVCAQPEDIDVAMCNGFGFPRHHGGPLYWAITQDRPALIAKVAALAISSGRQGPENLAVLLDQLEVSNG
jgi:3-hydroxyacyl-CoA dehydrogenase